MPDSIITAAVAVTTAIVALVVLILVWLWFRARHSKELDFPTLPGAWPLLGHLPQLLGPDHAKQLRMAQSPVWINLAGIRILEFTDPALMRRLFVGKIHSIHLFRAPQFGSMLSDCGIFESGQVHRRLRALCAKPFSKSVLKFNYESVRNLSALTLEQMAKLSALSKHGVDPLPTLQTFTFKVICAFMVSTNSQHFAKFESLEADYMLFAQSIIAGLFPGWVSNLFFAKTVSDGKAAKARILLVVKEACAERRTAMMGGEQFEDALSSFIDAKDESGDFLTDDDVAGLFLVLLMAGFETYLHQKIPADLLMFEFLRTSKQLSIMLHSLAFLISETDLKALVDEVNMAGALDSDVTLDGLPHLDAFVKESLRHFNVIPIAGRILSENTVIDGVELAAGTVLYPNRDMCRFMASGPDYFELSNFLGESPFDKTSPMNYLPFGYGERLCLGMNLAKLEMKSFVATVLRDYTFSPSGKFTISHFPTRAVHAKYTFSRKKVVKF
ncbi:Thromboxane-A synthase [Entophlyctis sp. JEL0112]|nr:Thromboxane-A synthase [Entophlyctis sp. JEL0112]